MTTRARSHWAWGWDDRFPDADGRALIAAGVHAMHGLEATARDPIPLAQAAIPEPEIAPPASVGAEVFHDAESRARATWGRAFPDIVRGFAGDFCSAPAFVLRPRSSAEVAEALAACSAARIPVVPRGGGSSVVGGVSPARGGTHAVLDLTALAGVHEVDEVSRLARIGAGTWGPGVTAGLAPHGLVLRHYPQSWEHSTVGGWVATRAGGHYATGRTHIDDLVAGVEMVAPSGTLRTGPLPASGAGPAPDRLVLGSEGTLGVITAAWLRVQVEPAYRSSVSVLFAEIGAARDAARAVAQSNLWPANCRLLDAAEAALNHVGPGGPVLVLGFEDAVPTRSRLDDALGMARACGGTELGPPRHREGERRADGSDAGEQWRGAFLEMPYLQSVLVSLGLVADTFETATTWAGVDALDAALRQATAPIFAELGGGRLSCRFTHVYPDGPAPYYTFLCQSRHGRQIEDWWRIKSAVSDVLLEHGATITHHHAVGRTHAPWYVRERPALFGEMLAAVRRVADPAGIMNPGVLGLE